MVGSKQDFKQVSETVKKKTKADEIEIRIIQNDDSLTRYANSQIHQNLSKQETEISIRAVVNNKVGYCSTNSFEKESIEECLRKAESIAKIQGKDPDFIGLPKAQNEQGRSNNAVKGTEDSTPDERAEKVKDITEMAKSKNVDRVFGAFWTRFQKLFVANSKGIERFSTYKSSNLTTTAISDWKNDQGFGRGESCSGNAEDIDHREVGKTAIGKGLNNLSPEKIEPDSYDVVLEPLAVKSIIQNLNLMGFSAKKVQEERSFLNGKFGEQIMDDRVNLYDDVLHSDMVGHPIDYEGVTKRRVNIIENGVANEVVHDSHTAGKENDKKSTGHALPMPDQRSPLAMNLLMDTGKYSREEMIEETDKGILVTRFHYCIPVHSGKGILTGLTRDGTWLIEDGEVKHPVKNLRFTQNLVKAFDNILSIGDERELFASETLPAYFSVPALNISDFDFTGTTEF